MTYKNEKKVKSFRVRNFILVCKSENTTRKEVLIIKVITYEIQDIISNIYLLFYVGFGGTIFHVLIFFFCS